MKKMIRNPNETALKTILEAIKDCNGFCPCVLQQTKDTKCPCKKFREKQECCCGLYVEEKV